MRPQRRRTRHAAGTYFAISKPACALHADRRARPCRSDSRGRGWYPRAHSGLRRGVPVLASATRSECRELLSGSGCSRACCGLPAQAGLPRPHHKHRKSTNMLERLNEEIRCRTRVVRIFPNAESCLPWERGLPGRIEKGRQGCERREGSLSPQRDCLTHDNLFAQIDRHNPFRRTAPRFAAAVLFQKVTS